MRGLSDIDFKLIDSGAVNTHPSLHAQAERAIKFAEYGTVAITVLQAIAAFSALGIVAIQYAQYSANKRNSSRKSRRSR